VGGESKREEIVHIHIERGRKRESAWLAGYPKVNVCRDVVIVWAVWRGGVVSVFL
jgi:hypothetical protein